MKKAIHIESIAKTKSLSCPQILSGHPPTGFPTKHFPKGSLWDGNDKLTVFLRSLIAILVLTSAYGLAGCNDNPFDYDELLPPALFVQVVDENNKPIPNVGFHYIFYCNQDFISRGAILFYGVENPDTVTLKIYDPFGYKKVIEKKYLQAGYHTYEYNGTTATNGVYEFEYATSTTSERIKFYLRTDNVPELESMTPLIISDSKGELAVSNDVLGIGQSFVITWPPDGYIIGNTITVVLVKNGYQTFTETITIDKNKASRHTFRMKSY
ncbi:MAG: hypothetical protein MN733_42160 [Nitrososphaera sp.]|nr:hypothetical protein [Nitrososphaera sp.]